MKSRFLFVFLAFCCALIFWGGEVWGQCNVVTITGDTYTVRVELSIIKNVVSNNQCPAGYNYNTEVQYNISFTGTNPTLYTLQGNVQCAGGSSFFDLPNGGGLGTVISGGNIWNPSCNPTPPASPEGLGCNSIQLVIEGRGINYQTQITPCLSIPNPVEFLSFNTSYQPQNRSALLDWSTAKEWENSHFEIERAVNSVKTWETIGQVEGSGYTDTPVEYNFTDSILPKTGGNIFYRLKQVDYSGKFSYSKTKAIQVDPSESATAWIAYPNPSFAGSDLSVDLLQLDQYHDEPITVRLADMLGEGESAQVNSPEEVSEVVSSWIRRKNTGLYILDIRWGAKSQQIKLLRH